jgi:lipopolysaccharide biosynthesis protein
LRILRHEGVNGVRNRLSQAYNSKATAKQSLSRAELAYSLFQIVPKYIDPLTSSKESHFKQEESVAIHLHLHYHDMIDIFTEKLSNMPCEFDLYVSITNPTLGPAVVDTLRGSLPYAKQIFAEVVPNRGRDIGAMIVQFGDRLSKYSIIGHFHTKKSPHNPRASEWLSDNLDLLLGGPDCGSSHIKHIFRLLQNQAKIVFPEGRREFLKEYSGWADNHKLASDILSRFTNLKVDEFPIVEFPEGSMFWARGSSLKEFLCLPLSYSDFPVEPIEPDGTIAHALERLVLVFASQHPGHSIRLHKYDSGSDYIHYESQQDYSDCIKDSDTKILSYYLPQFHHTPENNEWHGEGFTEWTKVRASNPLFVNHYQQHIPHSDIGYYLLDNPDILQKQADMMKCAGVHGQIFYHYWFSGRLILEQPARMLLDNPAINMPFCFCWANENWTRRWDGNESEILLAQSYSPEDAREFIRYLIPFFRDSRYIRIDARPVLFVYRPSSIPNPREYIDIWSKECQACGVEPPYIVAVLTRGATDPNDFGMDAGAERVLHDWTAGKAVEIKENLTTYEPINGSVLSYNDVSTYYGLSNPVKSFDLFRSLVPTWDNTPRYGNEAYIVHGSTPNGFQEWLEHLIVYAKHSLPKDRRFIIVNAWNEWAEGAHLEPDTFYGYSYLNSIGRALSLAPCSSDLNPTGEYTKPLRLHIRLPVFLQRYLESDKGLAHKFIHCLYRSSIFLKHNVSMNVHLSGHDHYQIDTGSEEPRDADYIIEFRRIGLFSPEAIMRMIQTALYCKYSVVIPNSYGTNISIKPTCNGSFRHDDAYHAPLVVYPQMQQGGYKNVRMRTDAHWFDVSPCALRDQPMPVVTTIIRFHRDGDIELLRKALLCLASMNNCICKPLIAAQDLSYSQLESLTTLLNDFLWNSDNPPEIIHYKCQNGHGDLRSKMLNEALHKVTTRYAAFLDYDDLLMPHAYEWMIQRLEETKKAVAFGRVYLTRYNDATGEIVERLKAFEYGYSYEDFRRQNHAPLHSFMIDMSRVDISSVTYHENHKYMEDYYLTLQLFRRDNCDWTALAQNIYVGDYIHSVNRPHTLAFTDSSERQSTIMSDDYLLCNQRIASLKARTR